VFTPKKGPSTAPPPRAHMRAIVESDDDFDLPAPVRVAPAPPKVAAAAPAPRKITATITAQPKFDDADDFGVSDDEYEEESEHEKKGRRRSAFVDDDVEEDEEYDEEFDDDDDDMNEEDDEDDDDSDDFGGGGGGRSRRDQDDTPRMTARQMAKEQGVEVEPLVSLPYTMGKKAQEREQQRKQRSADRAAGITRPKSEMPSRRTMEEVNKVVAVLLRRDFAPPPSAEVPELPTGPSSSAASSAPAPAASAPATAASSAVATQEKPKKKPVVSLLESSEPLEENYYRWTSTPKGDFITFSNAETTALLVEAWRPFEKRTGGERSTTS
jgi:hypothetical protein